MRKLVTFLMAFGGLGLLQMPASAATAAAMVNCATVYCFSPTTITIPVGSSVTWTNQPSAPHTATADSEAWKTPTVSPAGSATVAFNTAGTFPYHCSIHPFMHGTIVVTAAATVTLTPAPTSAAATSAKGLAQTGDGPTLPLAAALVLLGLLLLATGRRRRHSLHRLRETVDELPHE